MEDIILFGGGIIPDEDIKNLISQGVAQIFTPGTSTQDIIQFVKKVVHEKWNKEQKNVDF